MERSAEVVEPKVALLEYLVLFPEQLDDALSDDLYLGISQHNLQVVAFGCRSD